MTNHYFMCRFCILPSYVINYSGKLDPRCLWPHCNPHFVHKETAMLCHGVSVEDVITCHWIESFISIGPVFCLFIINQLIKVGIGLDAQPMIPLKWPSEKMDQHETVDWSDVLFPEEWVEVQEFLQWNYALDHKRVSQFHVDVWYQYHGFWSGWYWLNLRCWYCVIANVLNAWSCLQSDETNK